MQILEDTKQGSESWHAARASRFCASEAAAAMGVSKYMTRDDLLRQKHTGLAPEVDAATQRRFDAGHAAEAGARAVAEAIADVEFAPLVGTQTIDGMDMLASFDGIDFMGEVLWENKLWNQSLVAQIEAGELEPHYWSQLEHQLLVSGAERVLFTTSDGTEENTRHLWYESNPERRGFVLAAWEQFAADLAAYVPPVREAPKPVGHRPENLPALHIEVTGQVTASNLREFKEHALAVFAGINRELTTDQEFADAEQAIKWCADVESRLAGAKQHALSQTASIDELFRTVDEISAEARRVRLELDKLVKAQKDAIREEIVTGAQRALKSHIAALNERIGKPYMPTVPADFAGAIKGKRTLDSLRSATDAVLLDAKLSANEIADRITLNLRALGEHTEHASLFPDTAALVLKQADDLAATIKARIADHEAAQTKKAEAQAQQAIQQAAAPAAPRAKLDTDPRFAAVVAGAPAPWDADEPATLKLGDVNARLAPIHVTADGLRSIGIEPAGREKNATLYRESQFAEICQVLVLHLQSVAQLSEATA